MLSQADNEFLTQSGPGTPMGGLLRRFWMPALLSEELPERDGPPKKIKILGEELLAFRASDGKVGIVEPHCPHRGANLYYGRNGECGLRCAFHGWKFDVEGKCLDLPSSPPESTSPASATSTTFGWRKRPTICASRRNRSRAAPARAPKRASLMAHGRPSTSWCAAQTVAIPPEPIGRSSR